MTCMTEDERSARLKYDQSSKGRTKRRAYQKSVHQQALDAYGDGTCACCGSTEDLSLDHVDGRGAEHREELYGSSRYGGYRFYLWLRRNGYPPGYQVLCRPCNHSKAKTGRCHLMHGGPPGLKRCNNPAHEGENPLPLDKFYVHASSPGGRLPQCKACMQRDDPRKRKKTTPS